MRTLLSALVLMLFSATASAKYGGVEVDEYLRAYDGDTIYVDIMAFPPIVGRNIPIRVRGLETPEIRGKCEQEKRLAYEARDFVEATMVGAKEVRLTKIGRGSFFRLIATVVVDGNNLTDLVIDAGLGKPYDDPDKDEWCD